MVRSELPLLSLHILLQHSSHAICRFLTELHYITDVRQLLEGLAKHPIARRLLLCGALLLSMLVLASAVPGAVTALRGPPARAILLLPLIYALGTALLVGMSRHRMAIEPVLIVLAAGFLSRLRIGDLPGRERRAVFLGWGFLLFLWYLAAPEVTAAARSIWGGPA